MKTCERSWAEELLRLASGVMIAFGIVRIVLSVLLLLGIISLNYLTGGIFRTLSQILAGAFLLASGITEVICGSRGVKCVKRRRGAAVCLVLGGILLALDITAVILTLKGFPRRIPLGLACNAVLPVIYLFAALRCTAETTGEQETAVSAEASPQQTEPPANNGPDDAESF